MASVFNRLFMALQNKIITALPDIREVNFDIGQLNMPPGVRPPVSFPCVLIDFPDTFYEQKQLKAQWANMIVSLRLGFATFSSTSSLAPEEVRTKGASYFDMEDELYLALQDFKYEYEPGKFLLMLPMKRTSAATEIREDGIRVRTIGFKCTYEDRGMQAI